MITELTDRYLCYDGSSIYKTSSPRFLTHIFNNRVKFVDDETEDIIKFNDLVERDEEIHLKQNIEVVEPKWLIPKEYQEIDIEEVLTEMHKLKFQNSTSFVMRQQRLKDELQLYHKLGYYDVLKTALFIIISLEENNVVWGVGRGSSVSSYVLFILGLHDIDSFKYDIPISDFLREDSDEQ